MRLDLGAPVTWDGLRKDARAVFDWWWRELADMVPLRWRDPVRAAFERPRIRLEGALWRIEGRGADDEALVLDTDLPDEALKDRIARTAPAALAQRLTAVVPETVALLRRIQLPAAASSRLRPVVGLQLGRLSPLRGDEVRFDCRKLGDLGDGLIDVEVAIVPKAALEAFEGQLGRIGLRVARFEIADKGFSLAGTDESRSGAERLQLILAGLAAALWLAAAVAIPWSRTAEIATLSGEAASLRAPAAQALAARTELMQLQGPFAAAAARLSRPDALDVLRLLTDLMPDGVQLSDLALERETLRFSGTGGDAKRIAAMLNRSGRFRDARPVSSGAAFTIVATVVPPKRGLR